MIHVLGKTTRGSLKIDVPRLLETRLLVQANSGGGKSWALRRLLEQTANACQQIVIDPEGEFQTLREKHDFIVCAPHDADAIAHPRTAELLARRLLETGVSAVVDIYDLKAHERQAFVSRFLNAMTNAPKALWHPVIVMLDEAHVFAPEKGQAESTGAVIDMATRGRKRGQCLCVATQRLAKLHKDVAAEMLNKLVGRTGLDIDVKRAADELGMTAKEGVERLRKLAPGNFYAFGPALSDEVIAVEIGLVETTHPKAGQRLMSAPPTPSAKIKKVLDDLKDLPKEAEKEIKDLADAKAEITMLRRKLSTGGKEQVVKVETKIEQVNVLDEKLVARLEKAASSIGGSFSELSKDIREAAGKVSRGAIAPVRAPARQASAPKAPIEPTGDLTGPEQKILNAIAWLNGIGVSEPETAAIAFVAGYTPSGGAFNNPRGALRSKGLIEYRGDRMVLTNEGVALASVEELPDSDEALHQLVMARLPGPETKILKVLLDRYPEPVTNDELASESGYAPTGGAYANPRGRLRSLGLIEYQGGMVKARDILFPIGRST